MDNFSDSLGLYVHVPFCEQKCAYCDFFTVTDPDRAHPLFDSWLDLCLEEFRLWRRDFPGLAERPVGTIFFGGGTPSLLAAEQFGRFIAGVKEQSDFSREIQRRDPAATLEISLETQPRTLGEEDFAAMVGAGINRFSIGVQTFNPRLLGPTARRHMVADS